MSLRTIHSSSETASTLVVAMCTMLVLSMVAAGVLMNSTTRYNASYGMVKGWKEALYAAEAGADAAFAEIRKPYLSTPGTPFASGWDTGLALPAPQPNDWSVGYNTAPLTFGANNNLATRVTVDKLAALPGNPTVYYYRIRSVGTAQVFGLKRVGMDDALQAGLSNFGSGTNDRGDGDSLLRKIDFNFDHFLATYGYGDALPSTAATSANGKGAVAVADPNKPQVSRRVELVAIPMMPIEGAVKTNGGRYSFPVIDSYDSKNGAYPGSSCATTPSCPGYADARGGSVVDGSSTFNGTVYGDVTTNGGNAKKNSVSGVIDNNVPVAPVANLPLPTSIPATTAVPSTLKPSAVEIAPAGNTPVDSRQKRTFTYHYSSIPSALTIKPADPLDNTGLPSGSSVETTINIVVDGDINGDITVYPGVFAKIYFSGNITGKANSYDNLNYDGPQATAPSGSSAPTNKKVYLPRTMDATFSTTSMTMTSNSGAFAASDVGKQVRGVGIPSGTTITAFANPNTVTLSAQPTVQGTESITLGGYTATTSTSAADHLWFIGEGTSQAITLGSGAPATEYVVWYAPNADFVVNGNPDFVGAAVVKSFTGNGNNTMHFDKALLSTSNPLDYRVASYVEDVR